MKYLEDPLFLRQLIMDHYENPHHYHEMGDGSSVQMSTDSCIDDLTIYAKIEKGVIEALSFSGKACTIATASTSMMTDLLVGKSVEDAQNLIENYLQMVRQENFDREAVSEAIAFENVGRQPHRVSCASLGWRGIEHLINETEDTVHE